MSLLMYAQTLLSGYTEPTSPVPTNYVQASEMAWDWMVKRDWGVQCIGVWHTRSGDLYATAYSCDKWSIFLIVDTKNLKWVRVWRYFYFRNQ